MGENIPWYLIQHLVLQHILPGWRDECCTSVLQATLNAEIGFSEWHFTYRLMCSINWDLWKPGSWLVFVYPPSQEEVAQMFPQCSKNHVTLQTLSIHILNNGGKGFMIFNSTSGPTAYPIQLEGWVLHTCSVSPVKCWNQLPWIAIHIQTDMQY